MTHSFPTRRSPDIAPLHFDSCRALFAYDEVARPLVTGLKNRQRRDIVVWLADGLAALPWTADTVTWAPTSAARRRSRGFDQAELLARADRKSTRLNSSH